MKIYLLCMANETTVEIVRGYATEAMALKAMAGHPSSGTLQWGIVELEMITAGELQQGLGPAIADAGGLS